MNMEGYEGWDDYAPFYDWENAQTLGRRDVPFWRNLALHAGGPVLELGCGTGRISLPLARAGVPLIGVDRSAAMLLYHPALRRECLEQLADLLIESGKLQPAEKTPAVNSVVLRLQTHFGKRVTG